MSKKECKRVPSYAIRHLIQSLKEKGRTCRKGAEQRIDREILICDPEEEYVRRLAEALLLKKEVTAGVRICSSPEMVQELLKIGLIPSIIRPSNLKGFSLLDSVKLEYVIDVVKHDLQEILGTNNLEQLIVKKLEINANKSVPSRVRGIDCINMAGHRF